MAPGPFRSTGQVKDRAGAVLAQVACAAWAQGGTATEVGQAYNYTGVCDLAGFDALVGKQNRLLVVDGEEYRVVDATPRTTALPHIELALLKVRASG